MIDNREQEYLLGEISRKELHKIYFENANQEDIDKKLYKRNVNGEKNTYMHILQK